MTGRLIRLDVDNFRSLRGMSLPLGPLNVLVGPNGAGKTNVLEVFRFLADVIRTDLGPAISGRGGYDEIIFRGDPSPRSLTIGLTGIWTPASSSEEPDSYRLEVRKSTDNSGWSRTEIFRLRTSRHGMRKVDVSGRLAEETSAPAGDPGRADSSRIPIRETSSALSTLGRLGNGTGTDIAAVAEHLASVRVFDVDVEAARRPSRLSRDRVPVLEHDAANLSAFLFMLNRGLERWQKLESDAIDVLPQLLGIEFSEAGGAASGVVVMLKERGLSRPTPLADASLGTIRLLGLLALLHDPAPPALTCVEEIDYGLHPQALEVVVERLREASERTQLIVSTHSPALADRLKPEEMVLCERRDDGSSAIPAISTAMMNEIVAASEGLPLGELWFSPGRDSRESGRTPREPPSPRESSSGVADR